MARFVVDQLPPTGEPFELTPSLVKHAKALRLSVGDSFTLMDGAGQEASVKVMKITQSGMHCLATGRSRSPSSSHQNRLLYPRVTLIQALPKGSKIYSIVRMATEVGVSSIRFVFSERTVPTPSDGRFAARLMRLREIAKEATAVAGRRQVPEIHMPDTLLEVASQAPDGITKWVCWEESTAPLWDVCRHVPKGRRTGEAWLIIGPEGGFSRTEVGRLRNVGFQDVRIGPWVMRVETAAPVAVSMAMTNLLQVSVGASSPDQES